MFNERICHDFNFGFGWVQIEIRRGLSKKVGRKSIKNQPASSLPTRARELVACWRMGNGMDGLHSTSSTYKQSMELKIHDQT